MPYCRPTVRPRVWQLVDRPVLPEEAGLAHREVVELAGDRDRIPVVPEGLPHRRAWPDACQFFILFFGEHCVLLVLPPPTCNDGAWHRSLQLVRELVDDLHRSR